MLKLRAGILSALLLGTATVVGAEPPTFLPNLFPFPNHHGVLNTFNESGKLDLTGPFFQSLGPTAVVAPPATKPVTPGPSQPRMSPSGLKRRMAWTRSFVPMTAQTVITVSTPRRWKAADMPIAC